MVDDLREKCTNLKLNLNQNNLAPGYIRIVINDTTV